MRQLFHDIEIMSRGPGLIEFTSQVTNWITEQGLTSGLLTIFVRHTSASLLIQENADPDVQSDLQHFFERVVPHDPHRYQHGAEGPDDMPAHIRSALTQTSLSIPVHRGKLSLGTWQGIYLFEHRTRPHQRHIRLHMIGD